MATRSSRHRRAAWAGRPAAVTAVLILLAGCGTPAVPVDAPTPGDPACADLVASLPDSLDGLEQRRTDPGSVSGARAWGDPAIVVRCGVGDPADYDPTATCLDVNGVGWFASRVDDAAVRFTSRWSTPRLEVTVPSSRAPEGQWLAPVSTATRAGLKHPGCP